MNIYKKIIQKIEENNKIEEGDKIDYQKQEYETFPITKKNFHKLDSIKDKKIAFVDGGNITLIETPAYCVYLVRVFGALFEGNKKIETKKYECFVLATKKTTEVFWEGENLEVKKDNYEISKSGEIIRKQFELLLAKQFTKADLIVLDGTLEATNKEEKALFENLYAEAKKSNCTVSALAKTISLTTKKGISLHNYLTSLSPEGKWICKNIIKTTSEMHQAKISFLRLNESSKHVFRFEVNGDEEVASWLVEHSTDASFPGYPYGLIYVDMFARVTNEEKSYFATRFMTEHQKIEQDILSLNAHSILDTMR